MPKSKPEEGADNLLQRVYLGVSIVVMVVLSILVAVLAAWKTKATKADRIEAESTGRLNDAEAEAEAATKEQDEILEGWKAEMAKISELEGQRARHEALVAYITKLRKGGSE